MATADTLRYTRIPLTHGSGAIPAVGFGTLIPDPRATNQATRTALEVGFRHFDGAERYRNESAVGDALQAAIKAATIQRQDVFVTTKLWNNNHRPERVKLAFDASCRRLRIDYADWDSLAASPRRSRGQRTHGDVLAKRPRRPWDTRFSSLLELAEAFAVPGRWACRSGVCHDCESGLIEGELADAPEPLDARAEGNALICCTTPITAVELDL